MYLEVLLKLFMPSLRTGGLDAKAQTTPSGLKALSDLGLPPRQINEIMFTYKYAKDAYEHSLGLCEVLGTPVKYRAFQRSGLSTLSRLAELYHLIPQEHDDNYGKD